LLNLDIEKYSAWLDEHVDANVWDVCKNALAQYASGVNKRGEKQYDAVYPVLLKLGPELLQSWTEKN
jgi:hypothetical protein